MLIHRSLAVFVLVFWMGPSVVVLGTGLHLALDHHGPHEEGHDLADSARAKACEHQHAEAAPDHQHEVIVDGCSPVLRPSVPQIAQIAVLPSPVSAGILLVDRPNVDLPPTRGSQIPLFTVHRSLLL